MTLAGRDIDCAGVGGVPVRRNGRVFGKGQVALTLSDEVGFALLLVRHFEDCSGLELALLELGAVSIWKVFYYLNEVCVYACACACACNSESCSWTFIVESST